MSKTCGPTNRVFTEVVRDFKDQILLHVVFRRGLFFTLVFL